MDNTSIITQVTNPKEEEILSTNAEKGELFFSVLKLFDVARFVSFTHHFKRAGCESASADNKHFRHFIPVCTLKKSWIMRSLLTFNMFLCDSVLLLRQNSVCLFNKVAVRAQCKLLESESLGSVSVARP